MTDASAKWRKSSFGVFGFWFVLVVWVFFSYFVWFLVFDTHTRTLEWHTSEIWTHVASLLAASITAGPSSALRRRGSRQNEESEADLHTKPGISSRSTCRRSLSCGDDTNEDWPEHPRLWSWSDLFRCSFTLEGNQRLRVWPTKTSHHIKIQAHLRLLVNSLTNVSNLTAVFKYFFFFWVGGCSCWGGHQQGNQTQELNIQRVPALTTQTVTCACMCYHVKLHTSSCHRTSCLFIALWCIHLSHQRAMNRIFPVSQGNTWHFSVFLTSHLI